MGPGEACAEALAILIGVPEGIGRLNNRRSRRNVQRQAHVDSTVKARQRIAAQFQLFLSKQPPGLGANLLTAGPEHVLWFFQQEYTKQNTGEQLLHLQESVTAVGELLHSYCTECSTQSSPSLSQRR